MGWFYKKRDIVRTKAYIRTLLHKRMRTSFQQIFSPTALKIVLGNPHTYLVKKGSKKVSSVFSWRNLWFMSVWF